MNQAKQKAEERENITAQHQNRLKQTMKTWRYDKYLPVPVLWLLPRMVQKEKQIVLRCDIKTFRRLKHLIRIERFFLLEGHLHKFRFPSFRLRYLWLSHLSLYESSFTVRQCVAVFKLCKASLGSRKWRHKFEKKSHSRLLKSNRKKARRRLSLVEIIRHSWLFVLFIRDTN